jgi:hypothetical protein
MKHHHIITVTSTITSIIIIDIPSPSYRQHHRPIITTVTPLTSKH